MITASDLTNESARKIIRKKHREAVEKATKEFVGLMSGPLSCLTAVEKEWCVRAIIDDPNRAFECYRAIRNSQKD